jgi:predicted enzyme related to lactoylglutathione lyase
MRIRPSLTGGLTTDKEHDMLVNNRVSAVLVSTDLERSQEFYESKVGLALSPDTIKNHLVFECGDGTSLLIYGRGGGNKADHTQVRFWSDDIDKDVAVLAANGVKFAEYDTETFKTVDHVVTSAGIGRSAWFKDPDGNTIAVFQPE